MPYPTKHGLKREARKEQRATAELIPDFATTRTTKRIFTQLFPAHSEAYANADKADTLGQRVQAVGKDARLAAQVAVGAMAASYELGVLVADSSRDAARRVVENVAELIFEDVPG